MLGGASPLSRDAWSRRTREAPGRHRAVGSAGRVERTCGARDTNPRGGVVPWGRAGPRPRRPPSTPDGAGYSGRLGTDGLTADRGSSAGCPQSGRRAAASSRTAAQQSAEGRGGRAPARLVRPPKAERRGHSEAEPQRARAAGRTGGAESSPAGERWDRLRRAVRPLASGMHSRLARRDTRLRLG
jgi:hypothetical protein